MDCLDDFDFNFAENPGAFLYSEEINEPIKLYPPKAISPLSQYNQQRLPTRLVLGSFFNAYVANVFNPSHIYIQLGDEEKALCDMYHALVIFYSDPESKTFIMKNSHILSGSIGVAQWPLDMHWYRIKVLSLISDDYVEVFFIDYGTVDRISKTLLRYVREDFFNFPAQALRASLAYVKPPRGSNTWSNKASDRILELTLEESIKVKVEDIEDDVLSVILYKKNDICINRALVDENLAHSTSTDSNYLELVDISDIGSSDISYISCELPSEISLPTARAKQFVISMSEDSKNSDENSNIEESLHALNFSKPSEAASTSAIASTTSLKPQMVENELFLNQSSSPPKDVRNFNSSSRIDCEVLDDDDDAFFEEFYQKTTLVTQKYTKRIKSDDGYVFHILSYKSEPYVSCGDVSHLIWSDKDSEFLLQRLQNSESFPSNVLIWEDENLDMFDQLKKFRVKGFKVVNDKTCLLIFHLNQLIKILNIFGHPSVQLRMKIIHESSAFNLTYPFSQELSEFECCDGEGELDKTDDDKLNRLCLNDLHVMAQNIRIRRQNLLLQQIDCPENTSCEEQKLYLLYEKVMQRIKEIQQICSNFSDA